MPTVWKCQLCGEVFSEVGVMQSELKKDHTHYCSAPDLKIKTNCNLYLAEPTDVSGVALPIGYISERLEEVSRKKVTVEDIKSIAHDLAYEFIEWYVPTDGSTPGPGLCCDKLGIDTISNELHARNLRRTDPIPTVTYASSFRSFMSGERRIVLYFPGVGTAPGPKPS